ncbi:hypothetical protein P4S64_03490 [Vibrio sp. M60_M31a]
MKLKPLSLKLATSTLLLSVPGVSYAFECQGEFSYMRTRNGYRSGSAKIVVNGISTVMLH